MMMYLQVIGGFAILVVAAELMVRGAVVLADRMGVSPMVIGMTVVAFGTSAPELVVSLNAALSGASGLAVGNIVGSNIANIWLILGASCLVTPILVKPDAMIRDIALLIGGSFLFMAFALTGELSLVSGIVMLLVFAGFLAASFMRGGDPDVAAEQAEEIEVMEKGIIKNVPVAAVAAVIGVLGLAFGADLLVEGGSAIARSFGVSEEVIGLTLFAFGTSLPELAASVVAAYRGHPDVAVGNVVGSNVFNMLFVGGIMSVVTTVPVGHQVATFDIWIMIGATMMLMPVLIGHLKLTRPLAAAYFALYLGYVAIQAYGVDRVLAAI